jgi:hypothetical protein
MEAYEENVPLLNLQVGNLIEEINFASNRRGIWFIAVTRRHVDWPRTSRREAQEPISTYCLLTTVVTHQNITTELEQLNTLCVKMYVVVSFRGSWGSSVVSDYRMDDRGSVLDRGHGFFPVASVSRPTLRLTQLPIQWVPGEKHDQGVTQTTHPI